MTTLPEILKQPRYKKTGGHEALVQIFSAEILYEQKLERAMEKFGISKITAVRWYRDYKAEKKK